MILKNVLRLDNMPITKAHYTEEGYLVDNPIVTSVGIFEYALPDGGTRRELRLPEHVFDPESLASYEGKPVIITHDAGEVDKNNVEEHHIGTILTKGYRDGDDVRAKIVIHDTDAMKESELKELSLGYSLDLDETPGTWEGQHYDAIQTNIRVNHLALVENARAGKQARLNIDSRETLKGAKITMSKKQSKKSNKLKRRDSEAVEELADAVEAYRERRESRMAANHPADEGSSAEEQTQLVKDRRDRRDEGGDPGDLDTAMNVIAEQDEDIETLLGVVDALCAVEAQAEDDVNEDDDDEHDDEDDEHEDNDEGEGDDEHEDDDDEDEHDDEDDDENCDEDDDEHDDDSDSQAKSLNADSVDKLVRERVKLIRTGDRFNVDGIENMGTMQAKKAIIKKLKPSLRLDGKSKTYIDAAFDISVKEASARKDTNYQRKQMFNSDSAYSDKATASGAAESRQKMIDRQSKNGGKK